MPDPRSAFHSATLSTESNADLIVTTVMYILTMLKKVFPFLVNVSIFNTEAAFKPQTSSVLVTDD